jgi:hypothetical protein
LRHIDLDISYTPPSVTTRLDASPEWTRDARVRAWAFVFDCYSKKKAATSPVSRPDDGTKVKEDSANEHRST